METDQGSPEPGFFPSRPGMVFPLYHVFADIGDFAKGWFMPAKSTRPDSVIGLNLFRRDSQALLLANLTPTVQSVCLRTLPNIERAATRTLDRNTVGKALLEPEIYRTEFSESARVKGGAIDMELLPYAVVRVDLEQSGSNVNRTDAAMPNTTKGKLP
jgi:hypothetical protein